MTTIITNPAEPDKSPYAGIIYAGRVYNSATETKHTTSLVRWIQGLSAIAVCRDRLACAPWS